MFEVIYCQSKLDTKETSTLLKYFVMLEKVCSNGKKHAHRVFKVFTSKFTS